MTNITTVLFDLDGTLLPMDQDIFTAEYFKLLCKKMSSYGYEPEKLTKAVRQGMNAMVQNNGNASNETVFWNCFSNIFGQKVFDDKKYFDEFYLNEFQEAKKFCCYTADAEKTVRAVKEAGLRTVLATNPIFPKTATESRIRWAGLEPCDFEIYTTYENISYCKPNINYYKEILNKLGLKPQECVMVGNDVSEDMPAREIGMNVFLVTDCLINKNNDDINKYPHGSLDTVSRFILSSQ